MPLIDDEFMTLHEVALRMRCNERTVLKYLPTIQIGRKHILRREDVEEFLRKRYEEGKGKIGWKKKWLKK